MTVRHGDSYTRLYKIYKGMKERCYHPTNENKRKNYYDRGIKICDEWLNNYLNFKTWAINHGYNNTLTIDRINNDKGYCPDNCRWIPREEQSANRRTNTYITIENETHTMTEWCRINNVNKDTVLKRIKTYGWDPIKAVTTPLRNYTRYGKYSRKRIADEKAICGTKWKELKIEYNNETHNAEDWSKITGIPSATIRWRLKNNWTIDKALTKPVKQLKNINC